VLCCCVNSIHTMRYRISAWQGGGTQGTLALEQQQVSGRPAVSEICRIFAVTWMAS